MYLVEGGGPLDFWRLFGWLIACWLAGLFSHEITVHVLPEQYFSLTTISRNSIFQSCQTGPKQSLVFSDSLQTVREDV